jgi:hypothetical protein
VSTSFFVHPADAVTLGLASLTDPDNPFLTAQYMLAQRSLGHDVWIAGINDGDVMKAAALLMLKRGRLRRWLTIPASPSVADDSVFWLGLRSFCRTHGVTDLELSTFATPGSVIPPMPKEIQRVERTEFALRLADGVDLWAGLSRSHRDRVKKGRKNGLTVRRGRSAAAIDAHVALHINSMNRRKARGENVSLEFDRANPTALLASGAGELFQAMLGDHVASSLLVLRSPTGAYSESSGNSPEGMNIGASHFLRYETAVALQNEGVEVFYLGGVRAHEAGLRSYKSGFGTTPLPMCSVAVYLGNAFRRNLSTVADLLRDDPRELLRTIVGRSERYVAYVADPHDVPCACSVAGWELRKIADGALIAVSEASPELHAQAERLASGRKNDAYALYIDGVVAGIAWMIPMEHDVNYRMRNVKLRRGEVEITHCITLPEFRRRGVYTHMIRSLCSLARQQHVRRVFMITNRANIASQGGIAKAGLKQIGGIHRRVFDFLSPNAAVTFRRHRWGPLGWK